MTDMINKITGEFRPLSFEVPVLESSGYIRGILRDLRTSAIAAVFITAANGYFDKYVMDGTLGLYQSGAQAAEPMPKPVIVAVPLELPPVTELLELPDDPVIPPINRTFNDFVLCSVNTQVEPADAFLFDIEMEAHVDNEMTGLAGRVALEGFVSGSWDTSVYGAHRVGATGYCKYSFMNDNGQKTYHVTDAFPDTVIGTRQQLLDPRLILP